MPVPIRACMYIATVGPASLWQCRNDQFMEHKLSAIDDMLSQIPSVEVVILGDFNATEVIVDVPLGSSDQCLGNWQPLHSLLRTGHLGPYGERESRSCVLSLPRTRFWMTEEPHRRPFRGASAQCLRLNSTKNRVR